MLPAGHFSETTEVEGHFSHANRMMKHRDKHKRVVRLVENFVPKIDDNIVGLGYFVKKNRTIFCRSIVNGKPIISTAFLSNSVPRCRCIPVAITYAGYGPDNSSMWIS